MRKLSLFRNSEARELSVKDMESFKGGAIIAAGAGATAAILTVTGTTAAKVGGIVGSVNGVDVVGTAVVLYISTYFLYQKITGQSRNE